MLTLTLFPNPSSMGSSRSKHSRSFVPNFSSIVYDRHGREDVPAIENLLPGSGSDYKSRELDCLAFDKDSCGHSKDSMGKQVVT